MKNHYLKIVVAVLLCWIATEVQAQWSVGVKGGIARTEIVRSNLGRIDESYSPISELEYGVQGRYEFNDLLSIRTGISFMRRSHRMDRRLNYLDPVFTEYRNSYLMVPVMVDLSFGGEKWRGHLLGGGFAGYWLNAKVSGRTYWMTDYFVYFNDFNETRSFNDEDRRFSAGFAGGVGLTYDVTDFVGINIDALYYYDLISHHKGYANYTDYRYLNTLSVCFGVYFKL